MSQTTNIKILVGSAAKEADRRLMLGHDIDSQAFVAIATLQKLSDICFAQVNAGKTDYEQYLKIVNDKIYQLKHKCSLICNVKDKVPVT